MNAIELALTDTTSAKAATLGDQKLGFMIAIDHEMLHSDQFVFRDI